MDMHSLHRIPQTNHTSALDSCGQLWTVAPCTRVHSALWGTGCHFWPRATRKWACVPLCGSCGLVVRCSPSVGGLTLMGYVQRCISYDRICPTLCIVQTLGFLSTLNLFDLFNMVLAPP